jgi:HK97 family phage prohead protease
MSDAERRFTSVPVEIRASKADRRTIGGYAAKFSPVVSQNLGGFKEQIRSGFFNYSASQGWPGVMARHNHDDNMLLGTTGAGTLRLSIDNIGLLYDVDTPATRADVYELVERGDVRQSSYAFIADEDDWAADDTGFPLRTLVTGRLIDVASVNSPATIETTVGLRSLAQKFDAPLEEVRKLADANELIRFFKRTDNTGPTADQVRSSQAALAASLAMDPELSL